MGFDANTLVLSKSLALVEKTKRHVGQIDTSAFPTPSSDAARLLLLEALTKLADKHYWSAMNPESLYHALIQIQYLINQLEASTSDHISWPIVSYCDHLWNLLFPAGDVTIFYSSFSEHNYGISSFSKNLKAILDPVLPPEALTAILGNRELYCLQIASLEDENLPLYANIGHEFGHALFDAEHKVILDIFKTESLLVIRDIAAALSNADAHLQHRRAVRTGTILRKVATELFCDLVGGLIAGPAFLLSLHEMGWGSEPNNWNAALSPKDSNIRGYPSFAFRLNSVKAGLNTDQFCQDLQRKLDSLPSEKAHLRGIAGCISSIAIDHGTDSVSIRPTSDDDSAVIATLLEKHLLSLKQTFERYLARCSTEVLGELRKRREFSAVIGEEVFELLLRLEYDLLPNIIPDGTLLGRPATFATILNASALFRMYVLSARSDTTGPEEINKQIQKVERLTAKALEVSYIQGEFNKWKVKS